MKKDKVLLPNLIYDKSKDSVCFKFKNTFYLKANGKQILFNNYVLNNVSYTGSVYYHDIKVSCNIIKSENADGLLVNLEYDNVEYLSTNEIAKIGKEIESLILNILNINDSPDDYENENKNNLSDIDERFNFYEREDISDNSGEELNILSNNENHDALSDNDDLEYGYSFSKFNTA